MTFLEILLLQSGVLDVSITILLVLGTIATYVIGGMAWAWVGYKSNALKFNDSWDWDRANSTLVIGGFAGLIILVTGGEINGESIHAIAALAIPIADKVWNTINFLGEKVKDGGLDADDLAAVVAYMLDQFDDDELQYRLDGLRDHVDDDVDFDYILRRAEELRRDPNTKIGDIAHPIVDEFNEHGYVQPQPEPEPVTVGALGGMTAGTGDDPAPESSGDTSDEDEDENEDEDETTYPYDPRDDGSGATQ